MLVHYRMYVGNTPRDKLAAFAATTDDIELWATRFAQGAATLDDIFV